MPLDVRGMKQMTNKTGLTLKGLLRIGFTGVLGTTASDELEEQMQKIWEAPNLVQYKS